VWHRPLGSHQEVAGSSPASSTPARSPLGFAEHDDFERFVFRSGAFASRRRRSRHRRRLAKMHNGLGNQTLRDDRGQQPLVVDDPLSVLHHLLDSREVRDELSGEEIADEQAAGPLDQA
jgi:hypothetical protein